MVRASRFFAMFLLFAAACTASGCLEDKHHDGYDGHAVDLFFGLGVGSGCGAACIEEEVFFEPVPVVVEEVYVQEDFYPADAVWYEETEYVEESPFEWGYDEAADMWSPDPSAWDEEWYGGEGEGYWEDDFYDEGFEYEEDYEYEYDYEYEDDYADPYGEGDVWFDDPAFGDGYEVPEDDLSWFYGSDW